MTFTKPPDWSSGQWIALFCFSVAAFMSESTFLLARNDHDMKLLALGAVISTAAGLAGTASAILVGKAPASSSTGSHIADTASRAPDGSIITDATTIQTPPITPPV